MCTGDAYIPSNTIATYLWDTTLAVIIPGSDRRPHFAGKAFVRDGSKTIVASDEQFARLIAERNSKAYEILKWRGKNVTLALQGGGTLAHPSHTADIVIIDCNQFYVTFASVQDKQSYSSQPLALVELSFHHAKQRLELRLRSK